MNENDDTPVEPPAPPQQQAPQEPKPAPTEPVDQQHIEETRKPDRTKDD